MNGERKTDIIRAIVLALIGGLTIMVSTPSNGSNFIPPSNTTTSLNENAAINYFGEGENVTSSEIERVKQSNEQRLLDISGVTGVGIGQNASGNDVIIVYVLNADSQQEVPTEINGFTVRTEITGEIEAF